MKFDHIGIVVEDIKSSIETYSNNYNFKPLTKIIYESAHGVDLIFFDFGHGYMPVLELIMPTSDKSKVYNFLKKKGGGLHHLAYEVQDINKAINYFKSKKSIVLGEVVPGAGHNNTKTVWLYTSRKGLIELVEAQSNTPAEKRLTIK